MVGLSLGSSRSSRMALKRSWQYKVWLWHVFFQCFLQPMMTWFCQMNLLIISLYRSIYLRLTDYFNLDIYTCALLKSLLVSCRIVTCIWLFWKWCSRASIFFFVTSNSLYIKPVLYICCDYTKFVKCQYFNKVVQSKVCFMFIKCLVYDCIHALVD